MYGILVKLAGSEIKVGAFGCGHFKNAENRNFSGAPWRITVEKVAPPGELKLHSLEAKLVLFGVAVLKYTITYITTLCIVN